MGVYLERLIEVECSIEECQRRICRQELAVSRRLIEGDDASIFETYLRSLYGLLKAYRRLKAAISRIAPCDRQGVPS